MIEKRFTFVIDNGEYTFYDLSENGEIMNMIDTEDMLNELNKENYILKKKKKYLEEYNNKLLKKPLLTDILPNAIEIMSTNKKLENENEQLKNSNHTLAQNLIKNMDIIIKLEKENEQLKKENQELRKYLGWQDMELEEMEDLND